MAQMNYVGNFSPITVTHINHNNNQSVHAVGQYLSKDEYLKQLNNKLERHYHKGISRASKNMWKGQLTYFQIFK